MLNKIISVKQQYLKPFNCVQTNELWFMKIVTYKLFVYKSYVYMRVCLQTEPGI